MDTFKPQEQEIVHEKPVFEAEDKDDDDIILEEEND